MDEINLNFSYDGEDFTVNVDRNTLSGCSWQPTEGSPTFVVVFVHDFGSFVTQNHDIFDVITANKGAVYACDHLGHGRSPGSRLGCRIHDIIKEISAVLSYASSQHPNTNIYLYGQGGGALSILKFLIEKALNYEIVTGALLESPWLASWVQNKVGLTKTCFYQLLNLIFPLIILDTGFTPYTEDTCPEFIESSEKCPLYFPYMTPQLYLSAMKTITSVRNKIDKLPSSVHIMMCVGSGDTVYEPDELIDIMKYLRVNSKMFDGRVYNCGHLLTKEKERAIFLENALDFFSTTKKKRLAQ